MHSRTSLSHGLTYPTSPNKGGPGMGSRSRSRMERTLPSTTLLAVSWPPRLPSTAMAKAQDPTRSDCVSRYIPALSHVLRHGWRNTARDAAGHQGETAHLACHCEFASEGVEAIIHVRQARSPDH